MPDYETQTFEQYASEAGNKVVEARFSPTGGGPQTSIRAEIEKIAGKLDANAIASAPAKIAPVDNDQILILDSAAANGLKRVSLNNFRNVLKAVFDTLYAAAGHLHTIANITGLQDALNGKAALSHGHTTAQITGLDAALAGKAALAHGHGIGDVSGLQAALNGKANTSHSQAISTITGLQAALDGKAPTSHSQAISTITGLQAALNAKMPLAPGGFDIGATVVAATPVSSLVPGSSTRPGSALSVQGYSNSGFVWYAVSGGTWIFEGFGGEKTSMPEGQILGLWRRIA